MYFQDGRVNGVTFQTRLLGSSFLYPHVIPDPHIVQLNLHHDDQFIIIANHGLWKYITHEDAINQIKNIPDPVIAAKRLQDLAQGFGSKESIGILVIRLLLSERERNKMKTILQKQFQAEQELLAVLKERDAIREEERRKKKEEFAQEEESVPMDILKLRKHGKKRMQAFDVFHEEGGDYVSLALSSGNAGENWEEVLQKRLAEEVKNMELKHLFDDPTGETDALNAAFEMGYNGVDPNWNKQDKNTKKYKKKYHAPDPNVNIISPVNYNPKALINASPSLESVEFTKDYTGSMNVDRDAVLFHQMQIARSKSKSTDSMDSIQSVPNSSSSYKDVPVATKSSSHSIEVLIHKPHHGSWEECLGGSHPNYLPHHHQRNLSLQDFEWDVPHSCPDTKYVDTDTHVTLQTLDRKIDASMNNLFNTESETKSCSQECLITAKESQDDKIEGDGDNVYEDETIVSGYKTSPTIKDKKQRAPVPPPIPPRVSLEDLYAKPQKKERRAPPPPPPPPAPESPKTEGSGPIQEGDVKSLMPSMKPVVPPRTYLSKSEPVDSVQRKLTDSLQALKGSDVLNIRAKISKFESDNESGSPKLTENNVDYILASEGVETHPTEDKSFLKHEPDVNSNSLTSLQNFYFALHSGNSTAPFQDKSSNPFSTPSMESLLHKSLSQHSVIETYL